jgi:plasmid stabilization system protein ParE
MSYEVIWSDRADWHLDGIFEDLKSEFGQETATRFIQKVFIRADKLENHPDWIGSPIKYIEDSGYLQYAVGEYRIIFKVIGRRVEIYAVLHSRSLLSEIIKGIEG